MAKTTKLVGQRTNDDGSKSYQTSGGQWLKTDQAAKRQEQGIETFTNKGNPTQSVHGPNGLYLRSKTDSQKGNNLGELPEKD